MSVEQKIENLEIEINRYKSACQSVWAKPIDYTNLIDAQYAFLARTADQEAQSV